MKIVISLGGSIIIPDEVNYTYLKKFVSLIKKYSKNNKIAVVTGGGVTARKYINSLRKDNLNEDIYSLIGIATTKLNARLVNGFFNKIVVDLPDSLIEVKKSLEKGNIVIIGSLGFQPDMTSDGDAAQVAEYIKADLFLNLTNVTGLYDKDPKKFEDAKPLEKLSWKEYRKLIPSKWTPGLASPIDPVAARLAEKARIQAKIIKGTNLENMKKAIEGKEFVGTVIR